MSQFGQKCQSQSHEGGVCDTDLVPKSVYPRRVASDFSEVTYRRKGGAQMTVMFTPPREDPLDPALGIVIGVVAGLPIWIFIAWALL